MSGAKLSSAAGSVYLSDTEKARLESAFLHGAVKVEVLPEHWVHGSDEGLSWCYECAKKEVEKLRKESPNEEFLVDGGWGIEGDSTPFCEGCGAMLSNSYTQYACETEVDHFLENGFSLESGSDCYSMSRVVSSSGWGPYRDDMCCEPYRRNALREYYEQLQSLGRSIVAKLDKQNNQEEARK